MSKTTNSQLVISHFPKAYTFNRYAGGYSPTFDIISNPDHVLGIILGSSPNSYKEAWKQAADYVNSLTPQPNE